MREFAKFSPKFWINETGRKIKKCGLETRFLAFYLLTNPHANMIGVYYLPVTLIAHELDISLEEVQKGLQRLSEINFCTYDELSEYIWVHDMALDQIGTQLKPHDNRVKCINETYLNLPELSFLESFYEKYAAAFCLHKKAKSTSDLEDSLKLLSSKEKEKEKEKEKKISMSGKPDVVNLKEFSSFKSSHENKQEISSEKQYRAEAIEVLEFLNEKTGRAYRPTDANLKLIIARLKSDVTVMDCRQVIAKKNREWKDDPKMAEYLRPATLFNATKFEQYLGELIEVTEETVYANN